MANSYQLATAYECIPCTEENYKELVKAINQRADDPEANSHGFDIEFYEGEVYLFAEEYCDSDALPKRFLKLIGNLLKKANKPWLKVGWACYCDKQRPATSGGGDFKITQDGKVVHPSIIWPKGLED